MSKTHCCIWYKCAAPILLNGYGARWNKEAAANVGRKYICSMWLLHCSICRQYWVHLCFVLQSLHMSALRPTSARHPVGCKAWKWQLWNLMNVQWPIVGGCRWGFEWATQYSFGNNVMQSVELSRQHHADCMHQGVGQAYQCSTKSRMSESLKPDCQYYVYIWSTACRKPCRKQTSFVL